MAEYSLALAVVCISLFILVAMRRFEHKVLDPDSDDRR
jgi:hypothetical protein